MVTYDVDGAVVTNCVVEFIGASFASSTTVTNVGTGGATYNGTGVAADYGWAKSGAQQWKFAAADAITVPHGTAIDNQTYLTLEIGFYINTMPTVEAMLLAKMNNVAYTSALGLEIGIGGSGRLYIERDQNGSHYKAYESAASAFTTGHYYFLQITWDMSNYTNAPVVLLSTDGGARSSVSLTDISGTTPTAWVDDSADPLTLNNSPYGDLGGVYTTFFYRYHTAIVASADLTTNFNASVWRLASTWQQRTVPNVALATVLPTIGIGKTQTVVPNISAAKVAPAINVGAYPTGGYAGFISGCGMPNIPGIFMQSTGRGPVQYAPVEDACQIKFSNWPSTGTTITNEGLAGATYNAVASVNKYQLLPSGAAGWTTGLDGATIYIPHGAMIDNPSSAFTVEMMFSLNGSVAGSGTEYLYYKGYFRIYFACYGQGIYVYRATTDSGGYRWVSTAIGTRGASQLQGGLLFVQVTWDGSFANYPTVYINNTKVTFGAWGGSSGATQVWADDSASSAYILGGGTNRPGTLYLFRYHNRILSDAELTQNFNADRWRWQQGFVTPAINKPAANLTVPNTALAKVAPQVGVGTTQTVVPDISHAAAKPAIDIGVSPVSPNILAQTLQPALDIGSIQTVVPDVRSQTSAAPTIGIGVTPTVPDVRLQKVSPAVDLAITQQTVPDVLSQAIPPTIALAIIQHLTPDVSAQAIRPQVDIGVIPEVVQLIAEALAPTIQIGISQDVVPDIELVTQLSLAVVLYPLWLEGSTLDQTNLEGSSSEEIDLEGSSLDKTNADGASSEENDVDGSSLDQSNLDGDSR